MNQEERREKRKKDTQSAVIVVAVFFIVLAVLIGGIVFAVHKFVKPGADKPEKNTESVTTEATEEPETTPVTEVSDPLMDQAMQIAAGMTLEQKVAQMFMITPDALTGVDGATMAGDSTKTAYTQYPVGGLIYMAKNLTGTDQTAQMLTNMKSYSQEIVGIPVFLGVDEEGGTVARIASNSAFGVTDVGNMSDVGATGDSQNAYNAGSTIGTYLNTLGFNMDFAPVADVLTNPDNTVIKDRSFGSDSQLVADMVCGEMQGLNEHQILSVVKHFPGQGSSDGDTHQGSVDIDSSISKLRDLDFVPFKAGIDAGAEFVMVSHISVSRVTETKEPASMSELIMKTILREELGFSGIVITDAFDMASITDDYTPGEAALQSFMAGADIILMPNDLTQAYQAILNAVNSKKITQSRLDESVIRILTTKFKHGILTQEDLTVWEQPTATPSVTPAVTASPKAKKGKKNRESAKTIKKSTKNKSKK